MHTCISCKFAFHGNTLRRGTLLTAIQNAQMLIMHIHSLCRHTFLNPYTSRTALYMYISRTLQTGKLFRETYTLHAQSYY